VNAAGVAVLQKLLAEDSVFAEVLAEVQEDAVTVLYRIEFVSTDAICAVVDGNDNTLYSILRRWILKKQYKVLPGKALIKIQTVTSKLCPFILHTYI
jgi:hypothetical protein